MEIGEKLIKLLEQKTWTRSRLAKEAGVSPTTIANVIKENSCSLETARMVGRALGVPVHWLVDKKAVWPPAPSSLRDASDTDLMKEVNRRRSAWLEQHRRFLDLYQPIAWEPVERWCSEGRKQAELTPEVEFALAQELIASVIEDNYAFWFEAASDPFDPNWEDLKRLWGWQGRSRPSHKVLRYARKYFRAKSGDPACSDESQMGAAVEVWTSGMAARSHAKPRRKAGKKGPPKRGRKKKRGGG